VFAALAAVSFAVPAQDLSQSEVKAVLDRMEAATLKRDVDAVGRFLSEGAQLTGTLTVGTDVQSFSYTKQEYLQGLRDTWPLLVDLRFQSSNKEIVVAGRVATVTYDARVTMVLPAGEMHAKSRETVTMERLDGRVLVTRAVSHGSM
jgi:ketosteroid isomerase-like protein